MKECSQANKEAPYSLLEGLKGQDPLSECSRGYSQDSPEECGRGLLRNECLREKWVSRNVKDNRESNLEWEDLRCNSMHRNGNRENNK